MAEVEVTEEDTVDRRNWRKKIRCGDPWWEKPKEEEEYKIDIYIIQILSVCVCMCVCVCLSSIGGQTTGPIMTKFGTHMRIDLGMVPT